MKSIDQLEQFRNTRPVRAFLEVIAAAESGGRWDVLSGGGTFIGTSYPEALGKAAGKFQVIPQTWRGLMRKRPEFYTDFTPYRQEMAALDLLDEKGALELISNGKFWEALDAASWIWAGLPGPDGKTRYPPNNKAISKERARDLYLAQMGDEIPTLTDVVKEETTKVVAPIVPIIAGLIPELVKLIPVLGSILGSGSEAQKRNIAAATAVADVVVKATQTPNLQAAIEKIAVDPGAKAVATQAVQDRWFHLTDSSPAVAEARKTHAAPEQLAFYKNPAFLFSMAVIPLPYIAVYAVLFRPGFDKEIQVMVVTAILSGLLAALANYWVGSSWGSSRKTDAAASLLSSRANQ